jgi:hypothetical protein
VYGQFPVRDFNPLDKAVVTANGHHLLTIQFGLKGKVKLIYALDKGKPRYFQ